MTTLTQRYVDEVSQHLPQRLRGETRDELRSLIVRTVESRSGDTNDRHTIEYNLLTELGPPSGLAANYCDRPLRLIGPDLYRRYIHLLKIVLGTVLPFLVLGHVGLELTDGTGFIDILRTSFVIAAHLGAQLFTLITLVFVGLERMGRTRVSPWTPADLGSESFIGMRQDNPGGVRLRFSIAAHFVLVTLIVWQQHAVPYTLDGGGQVPIVNSDLFDGWMWPVLAGLLGIIVLDIVRLSGRAWNIWLASIYTVPQALVILPLAWAVSQQLLFDQRFLTDFNSGWQTPGEIYTAMALLVLIWFAGSTIDRFRSARASQRPGVERI